MNNRYPIFTAIFLALLIAGCNRQEQIRDGLAGHSSTCEVHCIEMETRTLPIEWGLPFIPIDQPYDQIKTTLFPNVPRNYLGGSDFSDGTTYAFVYVCPKCEMAEREWLNQMASETLEKMTQQSGPAYPPQGVGSADP